MLFQKKPLLYLQLHEHSLRYMAVQPNNHDIIEQGELFFETNMLEDGEITNASLFETRLNALVQEKKWKNAKTYLLVLNDFVTVREIEVPLQLAEDEIRDYLNLHMNQSIRMPFDNPSFDYTIYDQDEESHKLVLMAYPGEKIEQYQTILQNASLKSEVADVTALSLYRVAEEQTLVQKDQHTMLLQWNPGEMAITVFHQDRPTFNRHTQNEALLQSYEHTAKGEWIWKESEAELEMSIEEQLNNLERFLDFYRYSVLDGEESISQIILTGYYPNLSDLKARVAERFPMEVQLLNLPEGINQSYSALYGLTLRDKNGTNGKTKKKRGSKK